MPLYEFRCEACGLIQEYLLRVGQGPEGLSCRGCGASRLAKQFSTFATAGGGASLPAAPCGSPGGCGSGFS
ncbi:MAG: zinc ribbon domain-containing protein [Acidobacteria bacterium]|jgi:putative FmdB family regulatory protein|nr:zinc ribbon domain-containing protein [Acidobacteriota bacterium]